jgi:uncharacterized protein YutE (UPF0331/DUF86 family)
VRPEFVDRKLQLIAEDLGRLAQFGDLTHEDFVADTIRLAAIERMLERIVLRAIDVNEHLIATLATGREQRTTRLTYRETFLALVGLAVLEAEFAERIAPSAGLRNVLVHEYNDVDHRIVHRAIRSALADYAAYVDAVQSFVDRRRAVSEEEGSDASSG